MAGPVHPSPPRPTGGVAFTELASDDPPATRRFCEEVFGWKFRTLQMPAGEYLAYETPDGQGGIRAVGASESPSSLSYVRVADLEEARRRVEAAGAQIALSRVDVPGMGSFFWFRVPGGPLLACWQDIPEGPGSKEQKRP